MKILIEQVTCLEKKLEDLNPTILSYTSNQSEWTILQILEHLILVEKGIVPFILNNTGHPDSSENYFSASEIWKVNLDFSRKYPAPNFAHPKQSISDVDMALSRYRRERTTLADAIDQDKVNWYIKVPPHPLLGKMTKKDWIEFIISHHDRHLFQISTRIKEANFLIG